MEFVIAVLIGALILGDRIAPSSELRRRLYQISFGFVLLLFVLALNSLVFPIPEVEDIFGRSVPDNDSSVDSTTRAVAENLRERAIFIAAAGIGLILVGLLKAKDLTTTHQSFLFGGVLLLFVGFQQSQNTTSLYSVASEYLGSEAGALRNGLYLAVLGIGGFLLFLHGYNNWDRGDARQAAVEANMA